MTRRWFLSSVEVGAAADAKAVIGSRPSYNPAVKITRTVTGQDPETFPDRPGPSLQLLGPGDVIGFDRSVVVREEPPAGCVTGVANYLAHIDFSDASLPWLLSLPAPRKSPWLALLVLRDDEFGPNDPQPGSPLPRITVRASALPDLGDAWAWAHVEARVEDNEQPDDAVNRDVRTGLDNVVSRLICPRELDPQRGWLACVVPATKAGVAAGLGTAAPADGLAAAWVRGQAEVTLPVYYSWQFRTGPAGSFEELARQIEPVVGATIAGFGSRTVDVRNPWPHRDMLAGVAPETVTVPVRGALQLPDAGTADDPWTHAASMQRFEELITEHVNAPAARRVPGAQPDGEGPNILGGNAKAVAPPLYGGNHTGAETVPTGGWVKSVNTKVPYRIAAALGARYVQLEQEFLMARAWEQVGEVNAANRAMAVSELAAETSQAAQTKQLDPLSAASRMQLSSLYRAVVPMEGGMRPLAALLAPSAVPVGAVSIPFVRLTRRGGGLDRRSERALLNVALAVQDGQPPSDDAPPAAVPSADAASTLPTAFLMAALQRPVVSVPTNSLAAVAADTAEESSSFLGDPASEFETHTLDWLLFISWTNPGDDVKEIEPVRDALNALWGKVKTARERVRQTRPVPAVVRGYRRDVLVNPEEGVGLSRLRPPLLVAASMGMSIDQLVSDVREAVRPMPNYLRHIAAVMEPTPVAGRTEADPRPLRPIMAHPEFGFPVAAELLSRWPEWTVPGISAFPDNSSTLLEPNPAFVEAVLAGLNQEFNRELRWREYPTDEAGTPFSRFWPPGGAEPGYGEIALWGTDDALGAHDPNAGKKLLILLIRGQVIRRYPGTLVLAAKSVDRKVESPAVTWKEPRFVLPVDAGTNLYGFEGLTAHQAADEKWMFVVREPMRGTQFGFDLRTEDSPAFDSWPNLTWDEIPTENGFAVPRTVNGLPPALTPPPDPPTWAGLDASNFARIVFQRPFQLAFSASKMVGPPV